jgi:signal transduction histidine kinase
LSNAIKYSPKSPEIIVTTVVNDGVVVFGVQDFGIGIDTEYQQKIFERFFRVTGVDEKTYPGMGIGLHVCQEIVRRHGGKIWVESEKKKGSTFYFSIPLIR